MSISLLHYFNFSRQSQFGKCPINSTVFRQFRGFQTSMLDSYFCFGIVILYYSDVMFYLIFEPYGLLPFISAFIHYVMQCLVSNISHGLPCSPSRLIAPCSILGIRFGVLHPRWGDITRLSITYKLSTNRRRTPRLDLGQQLHVPKPSMKA